MIDAPKVKPALLFMLRNEEFLDVDCNIAENFELAFQFHQSEVNQLFVAEVRLVLPKSGQSALREEAVEEMKDLSTDETALVSVDSDARIWVEYIL
uniref:Uncharacterized protein n=1 Tax=Brassica oleracea var. oleracea TaxID=109376 RepID=A0A0D3CRP8_BRAOL